MYIKTKKFTDKHVVLATNALLPTHSHSTRHKCQSKLNTVFYKKAVCHKSFIRPTYRRYDGTITFI